MPRFLADENFDNDIVRGVRRRNSKVDIVRVQDVGLLGAEDPDVLAWAAHAGRILLTHDVATITKYAHDRVAKGLMMPGVFEVGQGASLGIIIEDIVLIAECSVDDEWEGQVQYLPWKP